MATLIPMPASAPVVSPESDSGLEFGGGGDVPDVPVLDGGAVDADAMVVEVVSFVEALWAGSTC